MSTDDPISADNRAILTTAQIIKAVMSPAAKSELTTLYINAHKAVHIRNILMEMDHEHPPSPVQVNNSTAVAIVNNNILPKALKAMHTRFHWLGCRRLQKIFRFYWRHGPTNKGDYPSKHHPGAHHRAMPPEFLTPVCILINSKLGLGEE